MKMTKDDPERRMDMGTNRMPTTPSYQPRRNLQPRTVNEASGAEIITLLSRLALHYWRPDFTEAQAKLVIQDFVRILSPISYGELDRACTAWLSNAENKFFPKPGELLALAKPKLQEGSARARKDAYRATSGEEALAAATQRELDEFYGQRRISSKQPAPESVE